MDKATDSTCGHYCCCLACGTDYRTSRHEGTVSIKGMYAVKLAKRILSVVLCIALFLGVFALSAFQKAKDIFGGELFTSFALQGEMAGEPLGASEMKQELIDVPYIKADGSVDKTRQIILYTPTDASDEIPLIYIPHYAAEESSLDFISYIRHGWAVAAPYDFKNEYNGVLETDDLVFNNAALYTLRHQEGIDCQRIAIVGGSAGGYMSMMLNALQMGTVASIANSPILNPYFNFHEYFPACDEVNRASGLFEFTMPIQGMVSKAFQPINDILVDDMEKWEAVSPISMAQAYSNPVVITHNTSDILVPIDQVTHRYTYEHNDGTMPEGFDCHLPQGYPGILSQTFEELADPDEMTFNYVKVENSHVSGDLYYADTLLTINVIDDGAPTAKGSHNNPTVTGSLNIFPYLEAMMDKTLAGAEELVPAKLLLLLERYQGNSIALPAHEGVDDTVYGSLSVYQQEVIDELNTWMDSHTQQEMDEAVKAAIDTLDDEAEREAYGNAWQEILSMRQN